MRTEQFFEHHGVTANPFAEEDAQTDPVFKNRCREKTYHPAWDKVFGEPSDPATSIVFGEKGAGKTAMRLQITGKVKEHNKENKVGRLWVVEYDDFNPFLDHFADRLSARKQRDPAKVLSEWKLWDHMDAILALAVTDIVNHMLGSSADRGPDANRLVPAPTTGEARVALDRAQKRDLLLLAACYDDSTAEPLAARWKRLRRVIRFSAWRHYTEALIGLGVTGAIIALVVWLKKWSWLQSFWPALVLGLTVAAAWFPWLTKMVKRHFQARRIVKNVRVLQRDVKTTRDLLMQFNLTDLVNQPLPTKQRTDDRYELLDKLQGVLRSLGVTGLVVLVDRVDEPHLINGSVERMRDLVWSMLDNKFLKQPGLGMKLLLPAELVEYLNRESRDFHQRARLDKQNMVPSLDWTGEALYDLANARLAACAAPGKSPTLRDLFEENISDQRIIDAFRTLRVPRHLFKFLYRLISSHCNSHTNTDPAWKVTRDTFESVLAVYGREQAAVDRGLSAT